MASTAEITLTEPTLRCLSALALHCFDLKPIFNSYDVHSSVETWKGVSCCLQEANSPVVTRNAHTSSSWSYGPPDQALRASRGRSGYPDKGSRQAKVGKEGELPVLLFLPSRLLGPSVYAGVHRCTLPSENTPSLRLMTYSNPTTREKAETEHAA